MKTLLLTILTLFLVLQATASDSTSVDLFERISAKYKEISTRL